MIPICQRRATASFSNITHNRYSSSPHLIRQSKLFIFWKWFNEFIYKFRKFKRFLPHNQCLKIELHKYKLIKNPPSTSTSTSISNLIDVFHQPIFPLTVRKFQNSKKIQTSRCIIESVLQAIKFYSSKEVLHFLRCHGILWVTKISALTILHFDKSEKSVFHTDYIELSSEKRRIAFNDLIAMILQIRYRHRFTDLPYSTIIFFHAKSLIKSR